MCAARGAARRGGPRRARRARHRAARAPPLPTSDLTSRSLRVTLQDPKPLDALSPPARAFAASPPLPPPPWQARGRRRAPRGHRRAPRGAGGEGKGAGEPARAGGGGGGPVRGAPKELFFFSRLGRLPPWSRWFRGVGAAPRPRPARLARARGEQLYRQLYTHAHALLLPFPVPPPVLYPGSLIPLPSPPPYRSPHDARPFSAAASDTRAPRSWGASAASARASPRAPRPRRRRRRRSAPPPPPPLNPKPLEPSLLHSPYARPYCAPPSLPRSALSAHVRRAGRTAWARARMAPATRGSRGRGRGWSGASRWSLEAARAAR